MPAAKKKDPEQEPFKAKAEDTEKVSDALRRAAPKSMLRQISNSRVQQTDYSRNHFTIYAEPGTTVEDLKDERYYAHVAHMLKSPDRITVISDDDSWEVELRVMSAGRLYAQVEVLHHHTFKKPEMRDDSMYTVEHGGGHAKWRVMRDDKVIRDGFQSKSDAQRWARSHEEALDR